MNDPRVTPANRHVAASELRGHVTADRFVEGQAHRVIAPVADLHCRPDATGLDRQLLRGDHFRVLEQKHGLAFGQAARGDYVGYVASGLLGPWEEPTHWISARASLAFSEPHFKTPNPHLLSYGSQEKIVGETERFSELSNGYFVPTNHLRHLADRPVDPVAEAKKLIGTPYLWGGNSSAGIDCSGLVQGALISCGVACPGDSDLQQIALGANLSKDTPLQRGDLLFWKGHVAWVADPDTLLHANAFHMAVALEPLQDAIARIAAQGDGPITARKRLRGLS